MPIQGQFNTNIGEKVLETYDWAKAAGLQGFETFWHRCRDALRRYDLVWPVGVEYVFYPANEGEEDYRLSNLKHLGSLERQ